eukprot:179078-Hanusia_phi.AAC.1
MAAGGRTEEMYRMRTREKRLKQTELNISHSCKQSADIGPQRQLTLCDVSGLGKRRARKPWTAAAMQ